MGMHRRLFVVLALGALVVGVAAGSAFALNRPESVSGSSAASSVTPTTLAPERALTFVDPVVGPAGTEVTVAGSQCTSIAGHVEVFFASDDDPDTYLARAWSGLSDPPGDWSTVLEVPDVDPGESYFIGAQCWGDGYWQGVPGQQVEYFGYFNVPFTIEGTPLTTASTVPTTTTTLPPGFVVRSVNPKEGAPGTDVTVSGSGCDPTAALDAYFAAEGASETPVGAVVDGHADAVGDWTIHIAVPDGLVFGRDNRLAVECTSDTGRAWSGTPFAVLPSPETTTTPTTVTATTIAPTGHHARHHSGYAMLSTTGHVYAFGDVHAMGNAPGPAVAIALVPRGTGYWITDARGNVSHFGAARDLGGRPALGSREKVTTVSATATGKGYWLFTNVGRAVPYGDARRYGDMSGVHLNGPIIASAATSTGRGYYMVASDGGVFTFGDARFHGSTGNLHLNQPVVGLSPTPDNRGYWLVARDGGVFAFHAPFRGSMGSVRLNRPVDGLVAYGNGYLMGASDGGVFNFSDKAFLGSLAEHPSPAAIIGISAFTD